MLYIRLSEYLDLIDVSAYIIRSGLRRSNVVYIMILWFRGKVYLLPLYKTFTNVCRGAWLYGVAGEKANGRRQISRFCTNFADPTIGGITYGY